MVMTSLKLVYLVAAGMKCVVAVMMTLFVVAQLLLAVLSSAGKEELGEFGYEVAAFEYLLSQSHLDQFVWASCNIARVVALAVDENIDIVVDSPTPLTDFDLDIEQYKPSGDDGQTDVGDDTCGFGIADTAVETCVVVDFEDHLDKINSVERMLVVDTCTDSVVHILALYVAFHHCNRESLGDTVFVEPGVFQSLLILSHPQFPLVVFD